MHDGLLSFQASYLTVIGPSGLLQSLTVAAGQPFNFHVFGTRDHDSCSYRQPAHVSMSASAQVEASLWPTAFASSPTCLRPILSLSAVIHLTQLPRATCSCRHPSR